MCELLNYLLCFIWFFACSFIIHMQVQETHASEIEVILVTKDSLSNTPYMENIVNVLGIIFANELKSYLLILITFEISRTLLKETWHKKCFVFMQCPYRFYVPLSQKICSTSTPFTATAITLCWFAAWPRYAHFQPQRSETVGVTSCRLEERQ